MFRPTSVATPMTARRTVDSRSSETEDDVQPRPTNRQPSRRNELGPIIRSKIQPPALRPTTLTRQRLIDQLREATSHRLTLLIAEAGYGKTTLLADFARVSGTRTLWYRLDENDADVVDWTNYLLASGREHDPSFGSATVALLKELATGGPPREAFISSVISELGGLEACPTLLVLDDFHLVDQTTAALPFVRRLVQDAPPWLSIVIASRRRPEIEIGRLSVDGQLTEIGTEDLRFSRAEVTELFRDVLDTPLDDDVVELLDSRTAGWIASLQLFYRAIQGRPHAEIRSSARALSGADSPLYDFLAEEVLGNLDESIVELLIRTSILHQVSAVDATALFADIESSSDFSVGERIAEAERLGLLTKSSSASEALQPHPLLRDFLRRQLEQRESPDAIRELHRRVARACFETDPLTAAHYFAEAGATDEAMHALGVSVWRAIGSGRWGLASELMDRLTAVPPEPAVAAIRARQLIEAGDLSGAAEVLDGVDVSDSPPEVRAIVRQTELTIGWRTGDTARTLSVLSDIRGDPETPVVLQEIAAAFVETNSTTSNPRPLPEVAKRFRQMAARMLDEGLIYYSAIALHDSAVSFLNAGAYHVALDVGAEALRLFETLPYFATEQLSTHTVMAVAEAELGNRTSSDAHAVSALLPGTEFADVPAELAFLAVLTGDMDEAMRLTTRARLQQGRHLSDAVGDALLECAQAASEFRTNPIAAGSRLEGVVFDSPLELGYSIERDALLAQVLLLTEREEHVKRLASAALVQARARSARRAEARLSILFALACRDRPALTVAIDDAARCGRLALLEVTDALLSEAAWLVPTPEAIDRSIREYPGRWLPGIRRKLEAGNTPNARAAATLLDEYGTIHDVGLLRAYAKTYAKRGPGKNLGALLARRTSPRLRVHDLGRVKLWIADREVRATSMRRKAASVLMYLITRPGLAANREQIIDELWPESDPSSGTNNLNQSLYYLRRDIDPWYEDDFSLDYVRFQGDLVWLEDDLCSADSVDFIRSATASGIDPNQAIEILRTYDGQFAPEFEYDEWAITWRSRVHSTYLELVNSTIDQLVSKLEFPAAARVAAGALQVDLQATDVERRLIWLYGRLGMDSAARTQNAHLARMDSGNGDDPIPLEKLLAGELPIAE